MLTRQLEVVGLLLIALAVLHAAFPRYFGWRRELASLSLLSRQIMYVHTFFVAFMVLLMGLLCTTSAPELLTTRLGHRVALGLGVFWLARLLVQFFGYSADLWRGKRFETGVHLLFSLLWLYLTSLFFWVALA
jgi:hypothetical protein